jgi:L-lactate dehydrogenase complex protein LldG
VAAPVSAAREEILGRVRSASAGAPEVEVPREYRTRDESSSEAVVERFAERVAEYKAEVFRVARADLGAELARLCQGKRMAIPADLPREWRPDGVDLVADDGLPARELASLDGALTGCAIAIAETGTVVLDGGEGQGRRVLSLVPDYHLCVVPADRIVGLVPEAVAALEDAARAGRAITFVSGPSATSDIELDRVEGVHGPRTLHVVIVA